MCSSPPPPITAVHPEIIQSHILNKLDPPSLASTTCVNTELFSLCTHDLLWKNICNSKWPSTVDHRVQKAISAFRSAHRSFYSDSISYPTHPHPHPHNKPSSNTTELISAVDIYYDDNIIYSKVIATETVSSWFLNFPFQLDLLGPYKETVNLEGTCMSRAPERLRVSWILIDTVKKRAANVASIEAVDTWRHWMTGEMKLRYATVVGGGAVQCGVVVTCGGGELHVSEVSMQLEDMEGKVVTGRDSLVILNEAMEGQRCKIEAETERDIYERFLSMKVECRERKQRRERNLDAVCVFVAVSIAMGILVFFFLY